MDLRPGLWSLALRGSPEHSSPHSRAGRSVERGKDSRTSPLDAVGFNLNFINNYDAGESYTEQEHRGWLSEAGFVDIERASFRLPEGNGVMTARKRG